MRRTIGLLVAVILMWATPLAAAAYEARLTRYADLPKGDWSEDAVYMLSVLEVLSGYEDGTFRPNEAVSREAFIKMLMVALEPLLAQDGAETKNESVRSTGTAAIPALADVTPDRWSYPYITEAFRHGWIDFMLEGDRFHPDKPMLREEVAALVGKWLLLVDGRMFDGGQIGDQLGRLQTEEERRRQFRDRSAIDAGLAPYVYLTTRYDIMEGDDLGQFRPKDTLTRKEAAAIVYRLLHQQVMGVDVERIGFYAIASYPNRAHLADLDQVIFGWSHLSYEGEGQASLQTAKGTYRIPDGYEEVVELAAKYGLPRQLMVYADGAGLQRFLRDETARNRVVEDAVRLVLDEADRYGFTGLCIDFEGLLSADHRPYLVAFLKELRAALGSGVTLSVAVPPADYYKGYDLEAIGQLADQVILMAHDYTHVESRLPSAPLPLVGQAIRDALKAVPRDKLVLGISKQANQWVESGGAVAYYSPAIPAVENRRSRPGVGREWAMPYFLERIQYVNGLETHTIWYESTESMERKIWLARYYGLRGVSFWHMGNLTDADWQLIGEN